MTSRKNAMLTTEDRRWLTGEKTYEGEHAKQQRYQRRKDIRERVYNSLLDFTILFEHLEEAEREKLFERARAEGFDDRELRTGTRDALAFVLYSAGVTDLMQPRTEPSIPTAKRLLDDALYRAGREDDVLVENVDLDIEATRVSIAGLLDDLEAGTDVSPTELRVLMESDTVDTAEVQECIRSMIFDD